jgi:hypothetical protein
MTPPIVAALGTVVGGIAVAVGSILWWTTTLSPNMGLLIYENGIDMGYGFITLPVGILIAAAGGAAVSRVQIPRLDTAARLLSLAAVGP